VSQPNQTGDRLKVALCTREYPPEVYGGAGVHVEYLAKELSKHVDLTVHCQGADRPTAVLACTHERTLDVVPLEALREHAVDVPDDLGNL